MRTTIVFTLKNRPKQDGTYPIIMRIIHNRESADISIGISVPLKDWDKQKRQIKSSYKGIESVSRLNNLLQKKKSEALDIITKLEEDKRLEFLSIGLLKEEIEQKKSDKTLFIYTIEIINDLKRIGKIGNARTYNSCLTGYKKFLNEKDIQLKKIDYLFLKQFEKDYLSRGNSVNGLSVYMRTLRAILNKAIKDKILDKSNYPFENYTIKNEKTRKRTISISSIKKIIKTNFDINHPLYHTRNYFLASYYMRGMSFADLAQLSLNNIIDNRVIYQRLKTSKPYNLKIVSELKTILEYYLKKKKNDDKIFPIIKSESKTDQYTDIEWKRKQYNKLLKELADYCGIDEHLTSYVSRHSFASHAKNLGVPVATISDMLGHESLKTTEVYLDSLPDDIMDDFHEKVINSTVGKLTKKK